MSGSQEPSTALSTGVVPVPAPAPAPAPPAAPGGVPAGPSARPAATPAGRPLRENDPDDAFLADALRGLEAEEAAKAAGTGPVAPAPGAAPLPDPGAVLPARPTPQGQVPAAALHAARGRNRQIADQVTLLAQQNGQLQEQIRQLAGQIEAMRSPPQPAAPSQADLIANYQARHEERDRTVAILWDKLSGLAATYDAGEIASFTEFQQTANDIFKHILSTLFADFGEWVAGQMAKVPNQLPRQIGLADQQLLDQQERDLVRDHPWLQIMNQEGTARLEAAVVAEMNAMGERVPDGPLGTYTLRARVAQKSDQYGPVWFPDWTLVQGYGSPVHRTRVAEVQAALAAAPQPATGNQPAPAAPRPAAVPPRAALPPVPPGAGHPPSAHTIGAPAQPGQGVLTEAEVLAMPFEALGALPPARLGNMNGAAR